MELNYHHLRLFLAVAHEGGVAAAARALHVTPQTVSAQVKSLERSLGVRLLERRGRSLVTTPVGAQVARRAAEAFAQGDEILDLVRPGGGTTTTRVRVGIADVLAKRIAQHLIEPLLELPDAPRIVCTAGTSEALFAELAGDRLDVVLSDVPAPTHLPMRAYDHLLGTSGVTLLGTRTLATEHRVDEPETLDGLPLIVPRRGTALRGRLDRWFDARGLRPRVLIELDDTALANEFAARGVAALAVPTVIVEEVRERFELEPLGEFPGVVETYFASSAERRLRNPAIAALAESARNEFFAS